MLDLVFNNLTSSECPGGQFFYTLFEKSIKLLRLPSSSVFEVSLNIVSEAKMKGLNRRYRNKNEVTDVLSFPLDGKQESKNAIMPLGDIFICLPFAKKQAKRENVNIEKKLSQLAVHGFLHLFGYDHEKLDKDRDKMEKLEKEILEKS